MIESMGKTYDDLRDDLMQVAIRFALAEREHDKALLELSRVKKLARTENDEPVVAAKAVEMMTRDVLVSAKVALQDASRDITVELERKISEEAKLKEMMQRRYD
jgi:hypothetical protein